MEDLTLVWSVHINLLLCRTMGWKCPNQLPAGDTKPSGSWEMFLVNRSFLISHCRLAVTLHHSCALWHTGISITLLHIGVVTIRQKRIAVYSNTWQPYHNTHCNILPWNIITEIRPNKHRNLSACCKQGILWCVLGASKWSYVHKFSWKREAIQRIQGISLMFHRTPIDSMKNNINTTYQKISACNFCIAIQYNFVLYCGKPMFWYIVAHTPNSTAALYDILEFCNFTSTTRLIDWLFTVLRPAQEFFTYMEKSPLLVNCCKM
jgi:hypothetical protein